MPVDRIRFRPIFANTRNPKPKPNTKMKTQWLVAAVSVSTALANAAGKHPFDVKGVYAEACSCKPPCGCEMTGLSMGCQGVGALQLTSGTYDGQDLSGLKAAYAVEPGSWVVIYIQPAKPGQTEAAKAFLSAVYHDWGKIEAVKEATIDITGEAGNYSVKVDDGKIMSFQTKVVLGGDKKTPVSHTNVADALNQTFMQALNESCTYQDGDHKFSLKAGSNSYFNDHMDSRGEL